MIEKTENKRKDANVVAGPLKKSKRRVWAF